MFEENHIILIVQIINTPISNVGMYEVEYPYIHKALLNANVIVENMFSKVDGEGNIYALFQEINDNQINR